MSYISSSNLNDKFSFCNPLHTVSHPVYIAQTRQIAYRHQAVWQQSGFQLYLVLNFFSNELSVKGEENLSYLQFLVLSLHGDAYCVSAWIEGQLLPSFREEWVNFLKNKKKCDKRGHYCLQKFWRIAENLRNHHFL